MQWISVSILYWTSTLIVLSFLLSVLVWQSSPPWPVICLILYFPTAIYRYIFTTCSVFQCTFSSLYFGYFYNDQLHNATISQDMLFFCDATYSPLFTYIKFLFVVDPVYSTNLYQYSITPDFECFCLPFLIFTYSSHLTTA